MHSGLEVERLATNLRVLCALHRALDLLTGLPVVVFKGPLSTQRAFGHLGARASADNDLWLPLPAAQGALSRLLAAGYAASKNVDPVAMLAARGQVALWPEGDLERVSLDLHARPFSWPYFEVKDEVLLEHLEEDTSTGRSIKTFAPELAFCHAVAHYVQHHFPDAHLDLVARLWLIAASSPGKTPAGWPGLLGASPELLDLVDRTCGRPAAALALQRAAELANVAPAERPAPRRARDVARILSHFRFAPPGVVRKSWRSI